MQKYEVLLKHIMGDFGYEKLSKVIQRKDNIVEPLELYLPLLVVPRAVLSWLVQNIKPMEVNEYKELTFPGKSDIRIQIHKTNTDVYRGEMIQNGKVIHSFDKQCLPSIGGHLMTVGELYDEIADLDEKKASSSTSSVSDLVKEILKQTNFSADKQVVQNVQEKPELQALTSTISKLVDALVAKHGTSKKADKEEKEEVAKDELNPQKYKEPITDHELQRVKHPKDIYSEHQASKQKDPTTDKSNPYHNKAEMPGGAAMPKPPTPPQQAPAQSKNPMSAQKQTMASAQGKQQMPKAPQPPKPPSGPGLANKPQGMQTTMKSDEKVEMNPTKKPDKGSYFRKKKHAARKPVLNVPDTKDSKFGNFSIGKLRSRLNARKSEKTEYTLSKEEVYNSCPFCGIALFVEENGKPRFRPCMCYTAMTKTEDGNEVWFVKISKLAKGGYSLKFNPKSDPESQKAFLIMLKHRLLSKKGI